MATQVEAALDELREALAALAPQLEGLRDYAKLELTSATAKEVATGIKEYDRRNKLMNAAVDALTVLMNDGYPDMAIRQVTGDVLAELEGNALTIAAALSRFESNQATSLGPTIGKVEPKGCDVDPRHPHQARRRRV